MIDSIQTDLFELRCMCREDRAEFVRMHEISREHFAPWVPRPDPEVTLHDLFVTCPRFFRVPAAPVAAEGCPPRGNHEPCARCVAIDAPEGALATLEAELQERAAAFQADLDAAAAVVVPSEAHAANLRRLVDLPGGRTRIVRHGTELIATRGTRPLSLAK